MTKRPTRGPGQAQGEGGAGGYDDPQPGGENSGGRQGDQGGFDEPSGEALGADMVESESQALEAEVSSDLVAL